jgi:hypothetical protein
MDGNQSCKCLDGSGHADQHIFSSDYFIPQPVIEQFKDDVRQHIGRGVDKQKICMDNWNVANLGEEDQI